MNFIKRAFTSIVRKPGKSLILLALVFVLCNVIAGAISVTSALNLTKRALLERMGAEVRIDLDYDWIYNEAGEDFDWASIRKIDKSIVDTLSESKYVKRADYTISATFEGKGIYYAEAEEGTDYNGTFNFNGNNQLTLKDEETGKIRLVQGRMYNADEVTGGAPVILISKKLAERNGLAVGDTATFLYNLIKIDITTYEMESIPVEKEFTVIGIFEAIPQKVEQKPGDIMVNSIFMPVGTDYNNTVYTTGNTMDSFIEQIHKTGADLGMSEEEYDIYEDVTAAFIIDSIDNVEIFEAENRAKLPMAYKFSDNSENLSEVAKPMENMKLIANIILYVAVGATVMVITLLVTLFLKDRIREMGIYLSLGERKIKIATQIIAEVMVVAVIAVTLSLFSGNMLASGLSSGLLADQLGTTEDDSTIDVLDASKDIWYDPDIVSGEDVLEEYNVSLTPGTIGFIYLVGLGSVFVSSLIPVIFTLNLKPRKILM